MSDKSVSVTFVGDTNCKLSSPPHVAKLYTELSQNSKNGITQVHALHTFRHDEQANYTRGEVIEMDQNTPAIAIAQRLRELGGHVSLIKLPQGAFESRSQCGSLMTKNIAALLDDMTDKSSEFARHGPADFSGVLRVKDMRGDKLQPYLVVHTNVMRQSDALREHVERNPTMTIGQLADSDELRTLQSEALIKNRLKMAELSNAMSVQQHINTSPDFTDRAEPGDEHHCPRDLAKVDIDTCYGTLRRSEDDSSKVLFYNRVVDLASSTGDGIVVPLSPLQGVHLYEFKDNTLTPSTRAPRAIVNAHANAMPLGLPHDPEAGNYSVSAQLKEDADAVLHWPGKKIDSSADTAVYSKLMRHVDARDVLRGYEGEYLNNGQPVSDSANFPLASSTLVPMAVLVRPDLQK